MNDTNTSSLTDLSSARPSFFGPAIYYSDPNDVLFAAELSVAEKREMLSFWASDARAVSDAPTLRMIDHGQIVGIHDILDALKRLDAMELAAGDCKLRVLQPRRNNPSHQWLPTKRRARRWDDDDGDDPPPCPAVITPLTHGPTSGAVNALEAA